MTSGTPFPVMRGFDDAQGMSFCAGASGAARGRAERFADALPDRARASHGDASPAATVLVPTESPVQPHAGLPGQAHPRSRRAIESDDGDRQTMVRLPASPDDAALYRRPPT